MADDKTVSFEEHTKVQQQLDRERERAQRNEAQLVDLQKKMDGFKDIDPIKYKAVLEDYELMKKQQATTPEKVDTLLKEKDDEYKSKEAKLRKDVQTQIDTLTKERDDYRGKYRELSITDKAMSEISPDFEESGHKFVKQYVREFCDLNDHGEIVIKDDKGEVRYSPVDRSRPMSVREFGEEIGTMHPILVKSKQVPGSMGAESKRGGTVSQFDTSRYNRMSPEERKTIPIQERGKAAMEALNVPATAFITRSR